MIGIYKITNTITGEVYIGQSNDIARRWSEHKKIAKSQARNTKLYQAMNKYGLDSFKFEILEECNLSQLNEREKYYIEKYDSINQGYNMSTIENLQHKINWDIVDKIIEDLREGEITRGEIAEKYNISPSLVSQINHGKMWYKREESYPIRNYGGIIENKFSLSKKRQYCKTCGKEITSQSIYCQECVKISKRIVERPSREELKEMIRTLSFTSIGQNYGVSDNAIRKWCDFYNLPRKKNKIKSYSDEEWKEI